MLRVMIFSPLRLFGEALVLCLESCREVSAVIAFFQIQNFCDNVDSFKPDIVLFDFGSDNTLNEVRAITRIIPEVPVLALALPETSKNVIDCVDAGFEGYVPRHASVVDLVNAAQKVVQGECACNPKVVPDLFHELRRRGGSSFDHELKGVLSIRESDILGLVNKGLSNKQIAAQLFISIATVKNHLHNVFSKLRVKGRTEAIALIHSQPWLIRPL